MTLQAYANRVESGVEWLGSVPTHWRLLRFNRCVRVVQGQVDPEDEEYSALTLIAPNHVESGTGRLLGTESAAEQGAESGKYPCRAGDVIYSKIRPALRKACIAHEDCLCSADMYPLQPMPGLTNSFLLYTLLSDPFTAFAVLESQRVAMPKVNRESLREFLIPVPSLDEQEAIVAFLNNETAKLDALIAEQERLIELLEEKRQAVIAQAITKGLNPSVPMKDSGIEWLRQVPAHWKVVRNKTVFAHIDERSTSNDGELLTVSHITGVTPRSEKNVNMFLAETLEGYKLCRAGDLVINTMWAWMGALGCSPCLGLVSPSYNVYRPRSVGVLDPRFYDYVSRIPAHVGAMRARSSGVWESRLRLYPDAFLDMRMALPPIAEQVAIAAFLDGAVRQTTELIEQASKGIALMGERRTALITAAVTGQIDVRPESMKSAAGQAA